MEDRHLFSKSSAMLCVKTGRSVPKSQSAQLFGETIQCVDTARYLRVTLDKRLTRSKYIDQARKKAAQRLRALGPLLSRGSSLSIWNVILLYKQLIRSKRHYEFPV
jgi:hypothetical protein